MLLLRLACNAMWLLPSMRQLHLFKQRLFFPNAVNRQHPLVENSHCFSKLSVIHIRNHQNLTSRRLITRIPIVQQSSVATMSSKASSSTMQPQFTNRLINERSPYLLQHAHNPVDWYPWGPEAFEAATQEDKLIFLSIGYSTCHWCHVMKRESFENVEIADVLKEHYIAIKLDREERPEVDKIYMSYVTRILGSGGWPLSVFLTPCLEPIYGGTYFPMEDRNEMTGLKNLLLLVASQWRKQNRMLKTEAKFSIKQVRAEVAKKLNAYHNEIPGVVCWKNCFTLAARSFEQIYGGFSEAPKFPQPCILSFLLHMHQRRGFSFEGKKSLQMVLFTLRKMGYGGILDHVGSGFARYTVDGRWHVPHFEKMLYDQAQLLAVYVDTFLITKERYFSEVAQSIVQYVARDLTHKLGGFYSAEDADSLPAHDAPANKEGAYYVWMLDEVREVLTDPVEFAMFCYHYDVQEDGNVDANWDRHNELQHQNIIWIPGTFADTAHKFDFTITETKAKMRKCLEVLREVRMRRPHPLKDTKIVAAWNGLMIGSMAKAGFVFKNDEYMDRAVKAANFAREYLVAADGSLFRCCYGNGDGIEQLDRPIPGILEDYAFLIRGLIFLYESSLDSSWLIWAEELQDIQNVLFWDGNNGAYFQSHEGDETVILRDKDEQDGTEPCGNSVAAFNLIRLDRYLDRADFREKGEIIFRSFQHHLEQEPISLPEMTTSLMLYHQCPQQIIIAGERGAPDTEDLLEVLRTEFLPGHLRILADGPDGKSFHLYQRNKGLESIHPVHGKAAAYVCKQYACSLPVWTSQTLRRSLLGRRNRRKGGLATSSDSD